MGAGDGSSSLLPLAPAQAAALAHGIATYGFAAITERMVPARLRAIQKEADGRLADAVFAEQDGALTYRANITGLGPEALAFLCHPATMALLTDFFDDTFVLSGNVSCLTIYREGDHLGPHLDKPAEQCDVTIIVCLSARSPAPDAADTGLVLNVYGTDPVSIAAPRLRIPSREGTVVLGRGSRIWHERPMLRAGETVVAITGCYRRAGSEG